MGLPGVIAVKAHAPDGSQAIAPEAFKPQHWPELLCDWYAVRAASGAAMPAAHSEPVGENHGVRRSRFLVSVASDWSRQTRTPCGLSELGFPG